MKKDNVVKKSLKAVAKVSSESSSWVGFYESAVPEKLKGQAKTGRKTK